MARGTGAKVFTPPDPEISNEPEREVSQHPGVWHPTYTRTKVGLWAMRGTLLFTSWVAWVTSMWEMERLGPALPPSA
ncbi:MAG: hypothetical protein ACPLRM_09075, partial [Anaerolineae bacterium]